ncbi:MAG: phage tail protein [Clostridium sp.]|uniref:phage tail protein n=1 Tax=Clostridium sp. TaxID=1506 RepID=UPI0028FE9436|nr:phage tail protein [Clostridium sp.]MDU1076775.1 phage tail protein [Clostridium sp.]MDU1125051.1 phage tail protein [Clostridium sp.]MDU3676280.1 phage tail protein [Clostridium sp.]MDU6875802.1 phage tail protein [Clostridium sp.]MDU6935150.1 phage tail protein [Clostridium sp.]
MADGKIIIDTTVDNSGAEKDIKSLSSKIGSMAKTSATAVAGMVAAATTAVATLAGLSVKQYAEYEQLTGGVETLFKNSSDKVMEYANNAYKAAGMSANEYMNTITGFAASLLQGLGGDTEKAAKIGNMAVEDMADNANKMGTSIELIQNAYQGFAKQNYTMLDNLKLGFGGTKEEMQRLLQEASKISGIKYDISNFSDIIEAIHAIQNEMGITGTTAKEAASTIEGSLSMTKSAWTNLLTGMADDNADFDKLVDNLVNSVGTLGENLLPRIEIAINGIGKLIDKLLPSIINKIPELISSILPGMVQAGINVTSSLVNGIVESLPMLLEIGLQALTTLGKGIAKNLPTLIPTIVNLMVSMCDMIIENLPLIVDVAIDIILALVQGLVSALPTLIAEVPRIINSFANAIYNALPQILMAGVQIIGMLIKGLIQSIPTLVANIPQIIMAIVNVFTLMNWASIGKNLITGIGNGIKSMVSNIGTVAKFTAESVVNGIKGIFTSGGSIGRNLISWVTNGISSSVGNLVQAAKNVAISAIQGLKNILSWDNAASIGKNLIQGLWNGISNMGGWIMDKIGGFASNIIGGIKDFFGIHSPSRVMRDLIGTNIVKGIGVGIDIETPNLEKDIDANMKDLFAKMKGTVYYETARTTARVVAENNVNVENTNSASKNYNPSFNIIAKVSVPLDSEVIAEVTTPMVIENISEDQNSYSVSRGGN